MRCPMPEANPPLSVPLQAIKRGKAQRGFSRGGRRERCTVVVLYHETRRWRRERERERLGRTERGKGDDQEWEEEERTLRLNGGPTEERASGRCLEQSWLMRALQLAAPHNGIKEGGRRWALPSLPLSLRPSRHRWRPTVEWSGWQLASSPLISSPLLPSCPSASRPASSSLRRLILPPRSLFGLRCSIFRLPPPMPTARGGGGISAGRHNTTQLLLLNTP